MHVGIGFPLTGVAQALYAALNLDFLTGTLDPRITFTRADAAPAATRFNSSGLMEVMGVNLALNSDDLTNAYWAKTNCTVTAASASPIGTAFKLTESATTGAHNAGRAFTALTGTYTFSIYAKAGERRYLHLCESATLAGRAIFDLVGGTIGATAGSPSAVMTSIGSGWYRCSITLTEAGAAFGATFGVSDTNTTGIPSPSYTGDGVSGLYVSAPQFELSASPNAYSPTQGTSTSGPRFMYDPATPAGVTGGELVTNGGWTTPAGYDNVTVNSGSGFVSTGVASSNRVYLNLATVPGKTYRVDWTGYSLSTGTAAIYARDGGGGGGTILTTVSNAQNGNGSLYFVAVTTASNILFAAAAVASTQSVAAASIKEVTFTPSGLWIEEQRTNLLLHSRDMTQAAWTKTDVTPARTQVGLDGVANTACLMTEGTALTAYTFQNPATAFTAGGTITVSQVLKYGNCPWVRLDAADSTAAAGGYSWFNLQTGAIGGATVFGVATAASNTMTPLGGGWYRCTLTVTLNGGFTLGRMALCSASANLSGTRVSGATYIVDCAQLEAASTASTIIVTGAASATRAADVPLMNGTNFSSWFNGTAGTFVVEYAVSYFNSNRNLAFSVSDTGLNRLAMRATESSLPGNFVVGNGTVNANLTTGAITAGVVKKAVLAYSTTEARSSYAGAQASVAATGYTAAAPTSIYLGCSESGLLQLNGPLRRLTYYNTRLPNATEDALSL
jgi:hypothetical protein